MAENKEHCFVIMPFNHTTDVHTEEYWTKHFGVFLKPLIDENLHLEACRSKPLRGDILREIITNLVTCPVVVADLTDNNCNVYWELGVRQSFKHGTITIAEDGTKIPFDIGTKGTLFYYPNNHIKNEEFRKNLKDAINDCLITPHRPDSHVLETVSGRGTLFEILQRDEAIRRLDALISECDKNLDAFNSAIVKAKSNQKSSETIYSASRLRCASVDLLITTRYINEDISFFELAEDYATKMIAINEQLNAWGSSQATVEKWLLKNTDFFISTINNFKELVKLAHEKISRKC
ncbi:MAG: hypothetical protein WC980_03640 [Candidatus Brocadiia bacterium]